MKDADAPGLRRYLLSALIWLGVGWALNLAIVQSIPGAALFDLGTHMFLLLPSLPCILLGMALFWFAISKADIRSMSGLVAVGALAGLFFMTGIAFAVMYAFREPDAWYLLLVPGCLLGGGLAGVYLARAFPRAKEWWPAPPQA